MRRLAALTLLAVLAAACGDDPCQELGERICSCSPGITTDGCTSLTESQLDSGSLTDGYCEQVLADCTAPEGAIFCEWLLTAEGKERCRLTPLE